MAQRPVPAMYPVTQNFYADATIYNYGAGHGAIDYGTPQGTPVVAVEDGVVGFADWVWNLPGGPDDWVVRDFQIKPAPGDVFTGGGIMLALVNTVGSRWWKAHLSRTDLNVGDRVVKGQVIGYTGNTGSSTGPHLHVSLIPPGANWSNGYFGAIDPAPYLTEPYAPITLTSWQGSPTTGKGSATTEEKDWFDMATADELRAIVKAEARDAVRYELANAQMLNEHGQHEPFHRWANRQPARVLDSPITLKGGRFEGTVSSLRTKMAYLDHERSRILAPVLAIAEAVRPSTLAAVIRGTLTPAPSGSTTVTPEEN